jgi:hypothetical protein
MSKLSFWLTKSEPKYVTCRPLVGQAYQKVRRPTVAHRKLAKILTLGLVHLEDHLGGLIRNQAVHGPSTPGSLLVAQIGNFSQSVTIIVDTAPSEAERKAQSGR